jgi:hypothetical protein
MPSQRARREHLLDGRRVRIMDLIDAGHLKPGDDLYYHQRIGEAPHEATVTERGRLRLHDGREFNTPSAAGAAVAGLPAVPGWSVWRRGLDGPTLHQLRQQLLKSVADEVVADSDVPTQKDDLVRRRFAFLEDAHAKAAAGEPKTVTVRELITLWDLTDRDRATSAQIDADLANHDLTTAPDFRAVGLDSAVRLLEVPEPAEAAPATAPAQAEAEAAASADEESIDIGLTLGNLLSGDWSLAWHRAVPGRARRSDMLAAAGLAVGSGAVRRTAQRDPPGAQQRHALQPGPAAAHRRRESADLPPADPALRRAVEDRSWPLSAVALQLSERMAAEQGDDHDGDHAGRAGRSARVAR